MTTESIDPPLDHIEELTDLDLDQPASGLGSSGAGRRRLGGELIVQVALLIIGGAIGNVIDRVRFGAVVDFFNFSGIWPPYFFNYVFNVADAAITVGAVLLFFDQFILSRRGHSAPHTASGR